MDCSEFAHGSEIVDLNSRTGPRHEGQSRDRPQSRRAVEAPRAVPYPWPGFRMKHSHGAIEPASLSALTAAHQLKGKVTALVVGGEDAEVQKVVEEAKSILEGVSKVVFASAPTYKNLLPEQLTPFIKASLGSDSYTHIAAAHSPWPTAGDNGTTFTRPIYAGNAISTVRAPSSVSPTIFTARATAFAKAKLSDSASSIEATKLDTTSPVPGTEHIETKLVKSDRPDLAAAGRVVSGGRALKDAETFKKLIDPLADVLGAAVGASRAAVDAGYVDNSLQVGQTGKVVAPELYIAVGISGAIQHLAGMKDSKLIVAINKDPDAPIHQVADLGYVADLYEAVPELVEKLKK
ncbi:electron transfer flavoprotein alpha subunit [Rhizoctonia solani]|nr:electron transfer flavoprotein alpha subunit [Rhizoctonia solani]